MPSKPPPERGKTYEEHEKLKADESLAAYSLAMSRPIEALFLSAFALVNLRWPFRSGK